MRKTIDKSLPILICGVGSVGERHINNLLTLGYNNIILYRTKNSSLRTIDKEFKTFFNLNDALKENPFISFITNPTSLHIQTSIKCAEAGSNLFIEKPLSNNKVGIKKLKEIIKKKNIKAMVGYMLRFHPCMKKVKELIEKKEVGNIVSTISIWGEYLPDWHPWENYEFSYAAQKKMGGGPALTLSHDIDLLIWLFGKPSSLKAYANYNSQLLIDTESSIDILINYNNNLISNVHLDYLQKPPHREYIFIGNKGKLRCDYFKNLLEINTPYENKIFKCLENFDRNYMFIEELKYFLNCIENNINPEPGIDEAYLSMDIALKALKSNKYKKEIQI